MDGRQRTDKCQTTTAHAQKNFKILSKMMHFCAKFSPFVRCIQLIGGGRPHPTSLSPLESATVNAQRTTDRTREWSENIISAKITTLYLGRWLSKVENSIMLFKNRALESGDLLAPLLSRRPEAVLPFASHSYATAGAYPSAVYSCSIH